MGLLPFLEHEARSKLDRRLRDAVTLAIETFEHGSKFTDDLYPLLFRLIFRLIAAKMLADRGHPGRLVFGQCRVGTAICRGFLLQG